MLAATLAAASHGCLAAFYKVIGEGNSMFVILLLRETSLWCSEARRQEALVYHTSSAT